MAISGSTKEGPKGNKENKREENGEAARYFSCTEKK
jgi:hypothetical protein